MPGRGQLSRRAVLAAAVSTPAWWLGGALAASGSAATAAAAVVDECATVRAQWRGTLLAPYDPQDTVVSAYVRGAATTAAGWWDTLDRSPQRLRLWADLDALGDLADLHTTTVRLRALALAAGTPGSPLTGQPTLLADVGVLAAARTAVDRAFGYATGAGDGFHRDGGYLQHTGVPYNGGYGVAQLQSLTHVALALRGTRWALTGSQLTRVFDWTQSGLRPWTHRGAVMDMVRGRAVSRFYETDHDAGRVLSAVLVQFAPLLSASRAKTLRSQAKGWIRADTVRPFFTYDPVAEPLRTAAIVAGRAVVEDGAVVAGGESTVSVVATSAARVVHRRPLFAFGLAMDTRAVKAYETQSGEDVQGWYTGEGTGYVYLRTQPAHWTDRYWPSVDRYRLPGTTVDTRPLADGVGRKSVNTWAGGAVVDGLVAAGCGIATAYQSLRARKSWFCLDDAIVCLGAGITSVDGHAVETVVENRNLGEGGAAGWTVDGAAVQDVVGGPPTAVQPRWAHLDGVGGYLFGPGSDAMVLREDRTGRWTDLDVRGVRDDPADHTRRFATLWLRHGVDPVDAAYSYVLLPAATLAQTVALAGSDGFEVVANTAVVQAVTRADGVTLLNAWTPGVPAAGGVRVDRTGSVVVTRRSGIVTVGVSDPTQALTGEVTVTVETAVGALRVADAGVRVLATAPQLRLAVAVGGAAGRTFVARFDAA